MANFKWHKAPITSVEWHPTDASVLCVAGADDQVTIWDMAVEPDTDAPVSHKEPDVPPQLLFIHQARDVTLSVWHALTRAPGPN